MYSAIAVLAVAYIAVAGFMYAAQRSFLYVPGSKQFEAPAAAGLQGYEPRDIATADGETLKAWYTPPPHNPAALIVYLHGNAGTLAERADRMWVYGRYDEPCLRCGTPVRMVRLGEDRRSTYWCPACQGASELVGEVGCGRHSVKARCR